MSETTNNKKPAMRSFKMNKQINIKIQTKTWTTVK